jgi:hypothetical protein
MKLLVWILLLINAMVLGYFQLLAPRHVDTAVGLDIEPAKIRVVTPEELAAKAKPEPSAALLPAPDTVPALTSAPASVVCYEWGSFSAMDAVRAKAALAPLALEVATTRHTPQEAIRYWVYIPPLKTPEAAQAKATEVQQLGVDETFIIQDPKWRNAISLGVFRDEGLATKFLEDLHNRGVKSAIKGQRNLDGEHTGYLIKNMTPAQLMQVEKLQPEFPGSDLKQTACK